VAYLLARLAALCGDLEAADQMFEQAQQRDERAGASAFVLRDLRAHERFLRATGHHARADALLGRASDLARSLGLDVALGDDSQEPQTLPA
jgi:hypothetical protein